ncbi:hypothetical protein DPMN_078862 [Dreissena polymorpha]|uniref:Uncharacterized protein n=1 Tax=Dreissena polymorpha TaxID=45954 RepID=A0A9D4BHW1_DREPO|nr:hypothetical protein DPMN_078862 [Dreissena polymorpha]
MQHQARKDLINMEIHTRSCLYFCFRTNHQRRASMEVSFKPSTVLHASKWRFRITGSFRMVEKVVMHWRG